MKLRLCVAAAISIALPVPPQTAIGSGLSEQQEADNRVIAARCGTPAFERAFFRQSQAAVAAGLIAQNRSPAEIERTISALRRNPSALVASSSDCPAHLRQLSELMKNRRVVIKPTR